MRLNQALTLFSFSILAAAAQVTAASTLAPEFTLAAQTTDASSAATSETILLIDDTRKPPSKENPSQYWSMERFKNWAAGQSESQAVQREQKLKNIETRLPLNRALKRVQGAGEREIVIFSDPNCRYCQHLDAMLASMDNLTVYTFVFPILSVDSEKKARLILCQKNPSEAWNVWMSQHKLPAHGEIDDDNRCDEKVNELLEIGHSLKLRGAPIMFFNDGTRINGLVPIDVIERKLRDLSVMS